MIALLAGNLLLVVTALLNTACVVAYGWTTHGGWRDSEVGRHLMAFMVSEATILDLGVVRLCTGLLGLPDPAWFQLLRLAVFVTLPFVMGWRLRIILRAWRGVLQQP